MQLVYPTGGAGDSYHRSIGSTASASHRDDPFPNVHMPTINRHEYHLEADLHPLTEGAEKVSHCSGDAGAVEIRGVEERSAKENRMPLTLQLRNQLPWEALCFIDAVWVGDDHHFNPAAGKSLGGQPSGIPPGRGKD